MTSKPLIIMLICTIGNFEYVLHRRGLLILIIFTFGVISTTKAGVCWERKINGKCKRPVQRSVTKAECCAAGPTAGYTDRDMNDFEYFFATALGDERTCTSCLESCSTAKCGMANKRCIVRSNGQPKCVCSKKCNFTRRRIRSERTKRLDKSKSLGYLVCGTDGKTYKNECLLKKMGCRHEMRSLAVAYKGKCKRHSCKNVKCPRRLHRCIEDQNRMPHCVKCREFCPPYFASANRIVNPLSYVCGIDGRTYRNFCELKRAACLLGKSVTIAYRGLCRLK